MAVDRGRIGAGLALHKNHRARCRAKVDGVQEHDVIVAAAGEYARDVFRYGAGNDCGRYAGALELPLSAEAQRALVKFISVENLEERFDAAQLSIDAPALEYVRHKFFKLV